MKKWCRARNNPFNLTRLIISCLTPFFLVPAQAQPRYPARPVTIVVPYPAGGSNDNFARELSKKLNEAWHMAVVVDNKPGAGGTIGAAYVSKAAPDGYTLCLLSSSFTTNAAIQPDLPFDPLKSFTPVAMVAKGPMILTVRNDLPVRTTLELFDYARKHPGVLNYATSGQGGTNHFATELLMKAAQIRMTHVPYKGMPPAITDLLGGHVDVLITSGPSILPQVKGGRVRALGITSARPSKALPGLRPLAEMGVPGYHFELWWGILAPPGLPAELLEKINGDVNRILATPEMTAVFLREGAEPAPMAPPDFARTIREEIDGWKKVAKDANIKAE